MYNAVRGRATGYVGKFHDVHHGRSISTRYITVLEDAIIL
jgi:hypothetical protein